MRTKLPFKISNKLLQIKYNSQPIADNNLDIKQSMIDTRIPLLIVCVFSVSVKKNKQIIFK